MIEHCKNNCETHSLRSTMKMSAIGSRSSRADTRCRFSLKRMLHCTLLACLLLQTTHASADYGDVGSSDSAFSGNNEEVYEPAQLQQEVEAMEQRNEANNSNEHNEMEISNPTTQSLDVAVPMASLNATNNHISLAVSPAQDLDKTTREQINNLKESSAEYSSEEPAAMEEASLEEIQAFYDMQSSKISTEPANIGATLPTTMIPEYLRRKPKAETAFNVPPTMANAASDDGAPPSEEKETSVSDADSASMSDYMEDDETLGSREYQHTNPVDIVPLAMKFLQAAIMEENNHVNNAQEQQLNRLMPPVPLPQQQLLPKQHLEQQYNNHSEEEYYEDSRDESLEQLTKQQTTTAPVTATHMPAMATTITSGPILQQPIGIVARAGFDLQLPPTKATTTTSTTLKTTVATPMAAATVGWPELNTVATTTAATTTTVTSVDNIGTTTTRPAGGINNKQGKQINILRRKLLPHEQLRNYIEDAYIRMPLAVIVDPSSESLEKTKALWRDALRTNLNIKIVLVSLNASGVPAAYSFNNTRQFIAGLNSIKENDGGNAFIGIVHASELVPYDSAVFISTASIPRHTELVQDAAITLLKKRIRLYLIWYGERSISENETQEAVGGILGEVAIRSGGDVLHIVGSENSQELEGNTPILVADAFRGNQEVDIPVDTTLSSLHVKIDSPMRMATLETPNGDINLKKLVKFKSRILTHGSEDKRLDAYVPLTKLRKATVFKLKIIPESTDDEYSVFVRADRKADLFLDDMIKRFDSYFLDGISSYPSKFHDSRLNSLTAALAAATIPTHDNIKFPEDNIDSNEQAAPKSEVEIFSEAEISKPLNKTTLMEGNNVHVKSNQRTTNILHQGLTKIEMGIQSQVLVAPGMMAQLYFEITNTRTEGIYHNIQVIDERKFLQRLSPQSIFLPPGDMTTVTVTVLVPAATPQGTVDKITFTCHGSPTVSLSLNLKVITSIDAQDIIAPEVSWSYSSRCENIDSNSALCSERIWILDVAAQDWQTGIMRLQSTPSTGLMYRNSYTVGSTEPLRASYIATCCNPKVSLVAHDIAGNQKAHTFDVRDLVLTEASIAAIVLGALLLVLLIILLVLLIVWCCKRRKIVLDLPTYRSHSTRSME